MQIRRWNDAQPNTDLAAELAEACEIHPFLALMLTAQGLDTPEQVYSYIAGYEEEVDPFSFADMQEAVDEIKNAIECGQKILVYGDYDVDGITSTVLLYDYFKKQGADVLYYIPTRDEGYGVHMDTVQWAAEQGVRLIVTVDTGVAAIDEVQRAKEYGIDFVITDHHQPGAELPDALAVVDPHREDCESEFKEFAGVGVAFMLLCALSGDGDKIFIEYGDLLALGTLADMMPLQGFNRDLMRRCLVLLDESQRPGLLALRKVAGLIDKSLTVSSVSFGLAPRLNAAGRMKDPTIALRLLLSEDTNEAEQLAEEIHILNRERQQATNEILEQVEAQLENHPEWLYDRVLVVCGYGWHSGLLGLVAARLVDRYGKPAIVLTLGEDGVAHGSCRSIDTFSIFDAIASCEHLLTQFGGHEQAAGITLLNDNVEAFRIEINKTTAEKFPVMPRSCLNLSVRLRPDQINGEKLQLLQVLEPFGCGNPAPLFGLYRMNVDNITSVGNGKHTRLSLSRDGVRLSAMMFQLPPEEFPVACGSVVNCVACLDKNEYRGNTLVSIRIRDISFTDTDREELSRQIATFCCIMRREYRPTADEALASREQLAHLYNLLHNCKEWRGTVEQLHVALGQNPPSYLQILISLELWQQAGLIQWFDRGERIEIRVLPPQGKADLTTTTLWKYIMEGDVTDV